MSDSTKPKRPWYVNCLIAFGAFFVLIIVIGVASGGKSTSTSGTDSANSGTSTAATPADYKIKEEAAAGDLHFMVNSITKQKTVGSGYSLKKSQSGTYAILDVSVVNGSKDTVTIDSSFFNLSDSEGRKFTNSTDGQTALMLSGGDNFFLKQVQPGLGVRGNVVFEIPEDATGLKLTVQSGIFGTEKATIDLE